jgi:hypothetical protein
MAKEGRPTDYRKEYCAQAERLCKLGLIDEELSAFFEVTVATLNNWKKVHPEFFASIKRGKLEADGDVAEKLYHRATGYTHDAVKIFADPKSGSEQIIKYKEHYPPDTTACIFWLKNRQPAKWRDKVEQAITGDLNLNVSQTQFSIKTKGK